MPVVSSQPLLLLYANLLVENFLNMEIVIFLHTINTHMRMHTHTYTHSAGVGRTGTFITIDNVLEQVEKEGVVDIARTVSKIRQQRPAMVKNVVSVCVYVCVHACVCVCVNVCMHACLYRILSMLHTYSQCLSPTPQTPSLQGQYILIHDAVLESVTCGETQIVAGNLQHALAKLQMGPKAGPNGLVSQFQVSNVYFREFKIMRIG